MCKNRYAHQAGRYAWEKSIGPLFLTKMSNIIDERAKLMMYEQKKTARPRGTDGAKLMTVIVTEALEGSGTEEDPCRIQRRFCSLDGKLLATGNGKVISFGDLPSPG